MLHVEPFQTSARVWPVLVLSAELPTATQVFAEAQDTPERKLPCAPDGFGVGWMLHVEPSHDSARVA